MPPSKQSERTETFTALAASSSSGTRRMVTMRDFDCARAFTRHSPPLNSAFLRLLRRHTSLSPATGRGSVMCCFSRMRML